MRTNCGERIVVTELSLVEAPRSRTLRFAQAEAKQATKSDRYVPFFSRRVFCIENSEPISTTSSWPSYDDLPPLVLLPVTSDPDYPISNQPAPQTIAPKTQSHPNTIPQMAMSCVPPSPTRSRRFRSTIDRSTSVATRLKIPIATKRMVAVFHISQLPAFWSIMMSYWVYLTPDHPCSPSSEHRSANCLKASLGFQ